MHRASPSSEVWTVRPEGNVTEVSAIAGVLWQVTQSSVPAGAGTSDALPFATKSWKPIDVWHLAQAAGTTAGSASFQWVKGSSVALACPDARKLSLNGTVIVGPEGV